MSLAAKSAAALALRPAAMSDADLLLDWANAPDSLSGKLETQGPIERASHVAWLGKRLSARNCRIWIIERGEAALGQLRFEDKGQGFEIDIYVAPQARGSGAALEALRAGVEAMQDFAPGARIRARVRLDNAASLKFFEKAGFRRISEDAASVLFEAP